MQQYAVYIVTNKPQGVLYTGVTSDLVGRIWEHKQKVYTGFSSKYNTDKLVWYEVHEDINNAIYREKTIKKRKRQWKIDLIEKENCKWRDLFNELL